MDQSDKNVERLGMDRREPTEELEVLIRDLCSSILFSHISSWFGFRTYIAMDGPSRSAVCGP